MIATPIMLLGLLGLLIWGGLWGWRNLTAPIPTPEPTPCVAVDVDFVVPADVVVNVYNGGYTRGLAERVATVLRDNGFNVARVSNTDEAITQTIVRGNEERSFDAMRLAQEPFANVQRDFVDRADGTVDILVGTEFAGYRDNPSPRADTGDRTYCMPAVLLEPESPSPDASAPVEESPTDEAED